MNKYKFSVIVLLFGFTTAIFAQEFAPKKGNFQASLLLGNGLYFPGENSLNTLLPANNATQVGIWQAGQNESENPAIYLNIGELNNNSITKINNNEGSASSSAAVAVVETFEESGFLPLCRLFVERRAAAVCGAVSRSICRWRDARRPAPSRTTRCRPSQGRTAPRCRRRSPASSPRPTASSRAATPAS